MPFKLKIFCIGKTKEAWLDHAIDEYLKRLKPIMQVDTIWAKDNAHLLNLLELEKNIICFDPQGKEYDSIAFAKLMRNSFEKGGSQATLVIGGSVGLPEFLRENFFLISLSKLTFTHQIARLILIEQIYRSTQIWQNTPYHK